MASSAVRPMVLAAAALGAIPPAAARAQDLAERIPNPRLEITWAQGLELQRDEEGEISSAFTSRLGATFVSETPISSLRLSSASSLRLPLDGGDQDRFEGPSAELAYRRQVPSSSLAVNASYSDDAVEDLGRTDVDEDDDGRQRRLAADVRLTLRDDRPLGFEFVAGFERLDYRGTADPDLVDRQTERFAGTVRLDFSEVLQSRATVRVFRIEEEGADLDVDLGFDLETSLARPDGRFFGVVSSDDSDPGRQLSFRLGREFERPLGPISVSVGARRGDDGDLNILGRLDVARDMPNGRVSLAVEQGVGTFDGDDEQVTTVAASLARDLTPLTSISIETSYTDVRNREEEEDFSSFDFGASLNRALTPDWSLVARYGVRLRDEGESGSDRVDTLSLSLQRSFVTGF